MLTLYGDKTNFCDGVSRRQFIRIGGLSAFTVGTLSLADLMRAQAANGVNSSHKAVINIMLGGGPPHLDMWDLKPSAPREIRGEFEPISTSVPGVQICELFPKIARMMKKLTIIRSVVGSDGKHDNFQCLSGWPGDSLNSVGGRPSIGSVIAKLQGTTSPGVPATVGLAPKTKYVPWSNPGRAGFLGAAYAPFQPDGRGMQDLVLNGISGSRLQDRRHLLKKLDGVRRAIDASKAADGIDTFRQAAFNVLSSSRLVNALDLSKEDPKVLARYGDGKPHNYVHDGAPTLNEHLLVARRLVEAGVRSVTLTYGRWDTHGTNHGAPAKNFDVMRNHGPRLDLAFTALIEDLESRGMLDDVTVVAWGEFGRTPRINRKGGRDHWAPVSCALLAGGGMPMGQVIGSTSRLAEYAKDRPIHMQQIVGMIYRNLGIDPDKTTIVDPNGRPQYLVDHREVIRELS